VGWGSGAFPFGVRLAGLLRPGAQRWEICGFFQRFHQV